MSSAACEGVQAALPEEGLIQDMPSESSVVQTPPGDLSINETTFYIWVSGGKADVIAYAWSPRKIIRWGAG